MCLYCVGGEKKKNGALNPNSPEPEGKGVSQKHQHVSGRCTARGEPVSFISLTCCRCCCFWPPKGDLRRWRKGQRGREGSGGEEEEIEIEIQASG